MFRVGQKVVCIKQDAWVSSVSGKPAAREGHPLTNAIYTVVGLLPGDSYAPNGFVILAEAPPHCGYSAIHFRPVAEKKTDISVFEEILKRETVSDHQSNVSEVSND